LSRKEAERNLGYGYCYYDEPTLETIPHHEAARSGEED